jgi:hypothetical protein
MTDLKNYLKDIHTSRKGIITHLNALTCMYLRQSGHMTPEATTLKRTIKLIESQCIYLQKNIEWEEIQRKTEKNKYERR